MDDLWTFVIVGLVLSPLIDIIYADHGDSDWRRLGVGALCIIGGTVLAFINAAGVPTGTEMATGIFVVAGANQLTYQGSKAAGLSDRLSHAVLPKGTVGL